MADASSKPLIESDRVEGTQVFGEGGAPIGTVKRLMIEKNSGRVAYAVIAFSGIATGGADSHTIPWAKLAYDTALGGYRTAVSETDLRDAPQIDSDAHDWSDRDREERLHDFYRIPPYWRAI